MYTQYAALTEDFMALNNVNEDKTFAFSLGFILAGRCLTPVRWAGDHVRLGRTGNDINTCEPRRCVVVVHIV